VPNPLRISVLQHSVSDAWLVSLSLVHAALIVLTPSAPLIAVGMWWNANTVSHNFIHLPFFRSPALNRLYAMFLTALLGVPQSLWRERHLRHHSGRQSSTVRWTRVMAGETAMVLAMWVALVVIAPRFFATVYLPGYLLGLTLCQIQGHFEHARGTTSYYGRLYNVIFFNDGYHVEHHSISSEHWTRLPRRIDHAACQSRWPPVLRWLDWITLEALERIVLRSTWLQRYVLAAHERAFLAMLPQVSPIRCVTIVGGGLFPRTALVLQKTLPSTPLTIVDASAGNLAIARTFLKDSVTYSNRTYRPSSDDRREGHLLLVPLAYIGDRDCLYRAPDAPFVLIHDWVWRRHPNGVTISWLLLKRLNLVFR
jgi:Fatty acid desaturase